MDGLTLYCEIVGFVKGWFTNLDTTFILCIVYTSGHICTTNKLNDRRTCLSSTYHEKSRQPLIAIFPTFANGGDIWINGCWDINYAGLANF